MLAIMMALGVSTFVNATGGFADVVYINGNIYTVDENFSRASIIATRGDRIVFVGTDRNAADAFIGPATKVVDLRGRTVLPGFYESHVHFLRVGQGLANIDVRWLERAEIVDLIGAEAARIPDGQWIQGGGWNQEFWAVIEWPNRQDLDPVSPNNPVFLTRSDNHAGWANTAALEAAGINADTPNPAGGEIQRDANGVATGMLMGGPAMDLVRNHIPAPTPAQRHEWLLLSQEHFLSYGITSFWDAGGSYDLARQIMGMYERDELQVRASFSLAAEGSALQSWLDSGLGPIHGMFDNRFSIASIKAFADGSLGARTAWFFEEFLDTPGHYGNPRNNEDQLFELLLPGVAAGFQPAIHAIGDRANHETLNAFERLLEVHPNDDHRFRIEHFQILRADDIVRAIEMGVMTSMQATHAVLQVGGGAEARLGYDRLSEGGYAWRKILDLGGIIAGGADPPVEVVNPFYGLAASVNRQDRFGHPEGGWFQYHAMTIEEAVRSFTIWGAFADFRENYVGSLEVGKLADFIVIDRDIMRIPAPQIREGQVLKTVLAGEVVFERELSPSLRVFGETIPDATLENGTTWVSVEDFGNALGARAEVTVEENSVTIVRGNVSATFTVGEQVGNHEVRPGVIAPAREIARALGLAISWHPHGLAANVTPW